jgi:hypothetical protein
MLEMFAAAQRLRDSDTEMTCVDMSPVGEWWLEMGNTEHAMVLERETPITPPVPFIFVCVVSGTTSAGEFIVIPFWISRQDPRIAAADPTAPSFYISRLKILDNGNTDFAASTSVWVDGEGRFIRAATEKDLAAECLTPQEFTVAICGLAMFHVRNIGLKEAKMPRWLARRADRKTGERGPTVYHTLCLRPFGNEAEPSGMRMPTGERPLHLVRGHFARYTKDRPVFGKYAGTFWRPEHEAGNPAVAVVRKTYKLDPMAKEPSGDRAG